jgi:adenylate cyclase
LVFDNVTRLPRRGRRQVASFDATVREHLEQLLGSSQFDATGRSREFLKFVVDESLAGRGETLNQSVIALSVFGRNGDDFDGVMDPIVRVQAGRLRRSLERYYLLAGDQANLRIELPKGGYAPVFVERAAGDERGDATVTRASLERVVHDWSAVLLHSFDVSSHSEAELAVRLQEEISTELCRYGEVHVIRSSDWNRLDPCQQASPRFELRGRLRRNAEDCLIRACLVDHNTGEQLWSDEHHTTPAAGRWATTLDDVGRVIAARIGSEQGTIMRALVSPHASYSIEKAGAFGAILRCHRFFMSRQLADLHPALDGLHQLVAQEPDTPLAWLYLARLHVANHSFELSDRSTPLDKAVEYASRGLMLDPTATRLRCALASALLVKGEIQAARRELEQALRLSADSLVYREIIGWLTALCGDWEPGMTVMRDAMARNPYYLPHAHHGIWAYHLQRGEFDAAYVATLEYRDPRYFWRRLMTTCCLGHLGRIDEARANAAELVRVWPRFAHRGATLIGYYIKEPDLRERILVGLRKAGLLLN